MKLRLISLLALGCATLISAAHAGSYSFKEAFSRTGAFSPTGSLSLENVNGNVTVRTWDKPEILIEGEKSAKTAEELAAVELTIDLGSDRAAVKVKLPKRDGWFSSNIRAAVTFTITLPKTATIEKLDTVNASVKIEGLQGPAHAETVNGRIEITDAAGDLHLETVNGRIDIRTQTLAPDRKLHAETVNGGITLSLPKGTGADIKAEVVNGHINCDFPLTLRHGGVSRHHLDATIGGGGAEISLETVNGGIDIQSI